MKKPSLAYDWAQMIDEMMALGLSRSAIYGDNISDRQNHTYRRGVQPLHWRGEVILNAWTTATKKGRDEAPTCPVVRGHRVDRRSAPPGPRMQSLPTWPAMAPVSVKPIKRRKEVA